MNKRTSHEDSHKAYTFKVDMIIQIIADDEAMANERLDLEGGAITYRSVELIKETTLPTSFEEED